MIVSWLVNELVWKTMDSKVRSEEWIEYNSGAI
jgi:hypothetical protein